MANSTVNFKPFETIGMIDGPGYDLNDLDQSGFYYVASGVQNAPGNWGVLLNIHYGTPKFQLFFKRSGVAVRDYTGSPGPSWSEWKWFE